MKNYKETTITEYPILVNKQTANIDFKYGPYNSVDEAYEFLSKYDYITQGLTFGVLSEDYVVTEYWFIGGTERNNIEKKFKNVVFENNIDFTKPGISGVLYVNIIDNGLYRWDASTQQYVCLNSESTDIRHLEERLNAFILQTTRKFDEIENKLPKVIDIEE